MKCKRLCAWLLSLVMMFSLLPVSAAAEGYDKHSVTVEYVSNDDSLKSKSDDVKETIPGLVGAITPTDETTPTGTSVYVYFKTVNTENELVKVESGVKYNRNKDDWYWATLGKLTTTKDVANASAADIGNEVKTSSNFVNHDSNKDFSLDLINKWADLKQENGADSYDDAPVGAWHLDGTVNVYKLSYNANRPDGVTASVTVPASAYYLPNWDAPVSTNIPELQGYVFRGWYTEPACKHKVENTVTVTGDTDLYAKWTSRAQRNAYLIDDDITITHGVNGAPTNHDDDDDSTVHFVNKDAEISYQATLDMKSLEFVAGDNTAYAAAVYGSETVTAPPRTPSPWDSMKVQPIGMFTGSTVNLHVKFSDQLDTRNIDWSKLSLTSDWFRLADGCQDDLTQDGNGYWTIPCVIKGEKGTGNSSKITLSGVSLPLTAKAQDELSSGKDLEVTSEGYIDGTIKYTYELSPTGQPIGHTYELSLIGMSEEDPAKNTAKLKLATYTVTYHGNGANSGETTDTAAYARGTEAPVMANGYARDGHTFTGWNTKKDGSGTHHVPGSSIPVTDHIHLYAQWSENSSGGGGDDSKTYYYFAIQKVDAQDGHALNGAKFELYQLDSRGNKLAASRKTTSRWGTESGIALFSVSATKTNEGGDTWYYREITAPEGYVLDSTEHKITKNDFSTSQNAAIENVKTVRNYRGTTPDLLNGDDHFAYVVGYQDGCVHPNALITRAETATIFFRLLKDSVRDGNLLTSNTFADVPNAYWANTAISTMAGLGIVQGYNSTAFDPNASITRAEFAAICARFDTGKSSGTQTFSDIKGHWAEKYIERAAELGWIKGFEDGTFRPNDCITRAQAMTMINRVLNRIPEDASDLLSDMNVWPDCNPGDWFYLAVQEATNSHNYKHKAGNYETWISMKQDPDWTRYEN